MFYPSSSPSTLEESSTCAQLQHCFQVTDAHVLQVKGAGPFTPVENLAKETWPLLISWHLYGAAPFEAMQKQSQSLESFVGVMPARAWCQQQGSN